MATNLTTKGWQRAVCPPTVVCPSSAGYAFDGNDIASAGVGNTITRMNISNQYNGFSSFHSGFAYSVIASDTAIVSAAKPLFGKNAIVLTHRPDGDQLRLDTTGLTSQTYTIGFWLNSAESYYNQLEIHSGAYNSNTYISLGINSVVAVNGSLIVNKYYYDMPTDGNWHFVRLINNAGTMSLYVDGVFKRQWSFAVRPTSLVFVTPQGASGGSHLRDIVVANVARNWAFVPLNIIGY